MSAVLPKSSLPIKKTIKQKFIIDKSGSMLSQQYTIISGFNEQMDTMRAEEATQDVQYLVSLTMFSDTAEIIFKDKLLSEVPRLTEKNYSPGGWTALYDAIGMTIDTAAPGESDNIVTIMTDGNENVSKAWKKSGIKALIDIRQKENKWGFVFFGANQDAWAEAQSIGVLNAVNYTMENTDGAMRSMSSVRCAYTTSAMDNTYNVSNLTANVKESELNS